MNRFEELDWSPTPLGDISLRRRLEPTLLIDVYEAQLGAEFLMSSLFTAAEVALADHGLAAVTGEDLDVVVWGLGRPQEDCRETRGSGVQGSPEETGCFSLKTRNP